MYNGKKNTLYILTKSKDNVNNNKNTCNNNNFMSAVKSVKDESVRMFNNSFLHQLSFVHYTTPLIIFVPVVLYCLYQSIFVYELSIFYIIGLYIGGLCFWTLTEYILHRFIFHYEPPTAFGKRIHFITHGVHHEYPNDSRRLVMPPALSIPLASAFYFLFVYIFDSKATTAPFFAGFINGYLLYDMLHYALHHLKSNNAIFLDLKQHHMWHHFKDSHNGFGVSSKFWDIVFRTTFKKITT